jgi:hypothetical protein
MRSQQIIWNPSTGWKPAKVELAEASLVLYFGARQALAGGARYEELRGMFPSAHIVGCSTGGQINNNDISDTEIVAAAIEFGPTRLRLCQRRIGDPSRSRNCGEALGHLLNADDLAGVFVLSDGLNVNGSELVAGITGAIGPNISLTGGLAGDGSEFRETLVGGDCAPQSHTVVAIGFYGSAIRIGHGSAGGWDVFGPRRQVTRSSGNVLLNSTASRLSISMNGIWEKMNPRHCQARRCCFRSKFTMRPVLIRRWSAPCLRSTASHVP